MPLALLLFACVASETVSDTGWATGWTNTETEPGDSGAPSSSTPDTGTDFVGSRPAEALGLPQFSVSNQYGLMRSADFLEGSPVALWFFTTGWTDC